MAVPGRVVGVSAAKEVGVDVAAAIVGVGDGGALVGVSTGAEVGDTVGCAGDGLGTSGVFEAGAASVTTWVAPGTLVVSAGAVGEGVVAQPRRSMRIRIATRMAVTIDLNRS